MALRRKPVWYERVLAVSLGVRGSSIPTTTWGVLVCTCRHQYGTGQKTYRDLLGRGKTLTGIEYSLSAFSVSKNIITLVFIQLLTNVDVPTLVQFVLIDLGCHCIVMTCLGDPSCRLAGSSIHSISLSLSLIFYQTPGEHVLYSPLRWLTKASLPVFNVQQVQSPSHPPAFLLGLSPFIQKRHNPFKSDIDQL